MEDEVLASMSDTERIKARMMGRMRQVSVWVRQAMSQESDGHGRYNASTPPTAAKTNSGGLER